MKINRVLNLNGPNIWANFTVVEAEVDLGPDLRDRSSEMIPGFNERLKTWLPGMIEHRCSIGTRGGFFQRLDRGTYMAHILEHVTLELLTLVGTEAGFGRARETEVDGIYRVAIESDDESLSNAALKLGHRICLAAVEGASGTFDREIEELRELAWDVLPGPSTASIIEAAHGRLIPFIRLKPEESLVQLGYGAHARRIRAAETDATSTVAETIAQDKELTRSLLAAAGVPTPRGEPVSSADEAWEVACEIGPPVVVKPRYGNHGRGVATLLFSRDQVVDAYQRCTEHGDDIIVEKCALGDDYRLLVIGDNLVAAARRIPAHVVGDGTSSVGELVAEVNLDPRRAEGHAAFLSRIELNASAIAVLADQGHSPESIPAFDERVAICTTANLSTGGTATDVTDLVHPDVVARAVDAALAVGLDIAGIDIIAGDISMPLEEQGGVVIEVNAGPGLRMHLQPSSGEPRHAGKAIVDLLFDPGGDGRLPIMAVSGGGGSASAAVRLLGRILRSRQSGVVIADSQGVLLDDRCLEEGDCSRAEMRGSLLGHPAMTVAVFEVTTGSMLREGLGFDRASVGIVTSLDTDAIGQLPHVHNADDLARVQRVVVEGVRQDGWAVLNADDPAVAEMADKSSGAVIFFSRKSTTPLVREYLNSAEGNRAVFLRDDQAIILAEGETERVLAQYAKMSQGGSLEPEVVLAAIAGAWALGFSDATIQAGLAC